jgi:hypothetical protein
VALDGDRVNMVLRLLVVPLLVLRTPDFTFAAFAAFKRTIYIELGQIPIGINVAKFFRVCWHRGRVRFLLQGMKLGYPISFPKIFIRWFTPAVEFSDQTQAS